VKSLGELQQDFMAGLYGDGPLPARVAVYRRNALANLRGALASSYPVVLRLVGTPFFNEAADRYARARPSTSGDLHRHGEAFATFLESYEPARGLAYLPDVARLEWAMVQSFHAADARAFDFDALAALRESDRPGIRLTLQPAARLVAAPFPVLSIWEANQPERDGTPDRSEGGGRVLVHRERFDVHARELSEAEWRFLSRIAASATLGELASDPQVAADLPAQLATWTRLGVIDGFECAPPS
jgi:hypothetical protein